MAQGRDPAQAGVLPQGLDLSVGQHAAVADQDEPLQSEAAAQGLDPVRYGGVAGVGLDGDRASALAVAAVAELNERAGAALLVQCTR